MKKVLHGCMPSQVIPILAEGIQGRLSATDFQRQQRYSKHRDPVEVVYVSKEKLTAGGYPSQCWNGPDKLGEKFTADDTCAMFTVLEGEYALWDGEGNSNRRWCGKGTKNASGQGTNQQWAKIPE